MAKNPNESDGGSQNELDAGFDAIERIGRRSMSRSAEDRAERARLAEAHSTSEGLRELIDNQPAANEVNSIRKGLQNAVQTTRRVAPRVRLRAESRRDRAVDETRNAIERNFSKRSINGQSNEASYGELAQTSSLNMMSMSPRDLEGHRSSVMGQMGELERKSLNMVDSMYDREGRPNDQAHAELRANYRKRNLLVQRLGGINAAERKKRALGEDTESSLETLFKTGSKANQVVYGNALESELKSGKGLGALSMDQLKQKETEAATKLLEALDKLKDSANKSAEEIDALKETAGKAAQDLGKVQTAIGMGGGSGGRGSRILNAAPQFLSSIAGAAQEMALNQPLQVLQNRTGFASMSNQLYDSRKSALGGNMQDLALLGSDAFSNAQGAGDSAKWISRGVTTTNAVASGISGGIGVAKAMATDGLVGTGDAVSGIANTAVSVSDLAQGATAQSYNLNYQGANLGLDRERAYVTADMRQNLYNYGMGGRKAMLAGGGTSGRSFFETNVSGGDNASIPMISPMQRMENAGIGTDQFSALSEQGFGQQGSRFNSSQIFTARNLERSGFGDMSTNMSRMGSLAAGGANNPQAGLQSVLESAFTKSLDSSKALNMMVENTASLVSQSQGNQTGLVDTTKSAAGIIGNLVNGDNPNQEAALNRAMNVEQRQNAINTGIGRNFADMAGVAAISQQAGVDNPTAINLKKMDDQTIAALKQEVSRVSSSGDAAAKTKLGNDLIQRGLGGFVGANRQVDASRLNRAIDLRGQSNFREAGILGTAAGDVGFAEAASGKIGMNDLQTNPKYDKLYRDLAKGAALPGSDMTLQEFLAGGKSVNASGAAVKAAGAATSGTTLISDAQKSADDLATASAKETTKEARLAAEQLGGVAIALKRIREATEGLSGKLNESTADDFRGAAANAAKDFNNGAKTFTAGVNEFGKYVGQLAGRAPKLDTSNNTAKKGA